MIEKISKPEGALESLNRYKLYELKEAMLNRQVLEGYLSKVDSDLNAYLDTTPITNGKLVKVIVPFDEFEYRIKGRALRNSIVQRYIGKTICFMVKSIIEKEKEIIVTCSRREAQEEYYDYLVSKVKSGTILNGCVKRAEDYGLFVDIGRGVTALLPLENICMSHLPGAKELKDLTNVKVVFAGVDGQGRLLVSMKELLGTWEEEIAKFNPGEMVIGRIRQIQYETVVVEVEPNLAGIADLPYKFEVREGDIVKVVVKGFDEVNLRFKLAVIDTMDKPSNYDKIYAEKLVNNYRIEDGNEYIGYWRYSPINCTKEIETIFNEDIAKIEKRKIEELRDTEFNNTYIDDEEEYEVDEEENPIYIV